MDEVAANISSSSLSNIAELSFPWYYLRLLYAWFWVLSAPPPIDLFANREELVAVVDEGFWSIFKLVLFDVRYLIWVLMIPLFKLLLHKCTFPPSTEESQSLSLFVLIEETALCTFQINWSRSLHSTSPWCVMVSLIGSSCIILSIKTGFVSINIIWPW
jgi:hypothetical protein